MATGRIGRVVEGALGGALGTAFIQQAMRLAPKLPPALRPPEMKADPAEVVTERVERASGQRLSPAVRDIVERSLGWAYGVGWGAALGAVADRLGIRTWRDAAVAGAAAGVAVWAVGYGGWLPAAAITKPLRRQGLTHIASALATHVAYGVLTALPLVPRRVARPPSPLVLGPRSV